MAACLDGAPNVNLTVVSSPGEAGPGLLERRGCCTLSLSEGGVALLFPSPRGRWPWPVRGRMDRGTLGGRSLTDPGLGSSGQGRHGAVWGVWGAMGKVLGTARVVLEGI